MARQTAGEPPLRNRESRAWNAVLDLHGALSARLNRAIGRDTGLTLAKFDVLAQVFHSPDGITQGSLSRQLKVTGGNVTGLVRRLVADGLITREPMASDRRAVVVRLTAQGRETYLAARARHDALLAEWLGGIGRADLARVEAILLMLKAAVERSGAATMPADKTTTGPTTDKGKTG